MPRVETGLVEDFEAALLSLDRLAAGRLLNDACAALGVDSCVEQLVMPTLERIGAGWEKGTIALSQVYMSGRICEGLMGGVLPPSAGGSDRSEIAVAVLEDHHTLGKKIVCAHLRAGGFSFVDYGGGLSVDRLTGLVEKDQIKVLLISVLMLRSALRVKALRDSFDEAGLDVRIGVGGAPFRFDPLLWREVGADAMGRTADEALAIVKKLA